MCSNSQRAAVAITQGDPGGVGPELIVRAWGDKRLQALGPLVVFGQPEILHAAAREFAPQVVVREIDARASFPSLAPLPFSPLEIPCLRTSDMSMSRWERGGANRASGEIALQAILAAAARALSGEVRGIVTLPISKHALHLAGVKVPGHTELLAECCGVHASSMMLYLPPGDRRGPAGLGVVHTTLHMSVRSAVERIDSPLIVASARRLHNLMGTFCLHYGVTRSPTLGVCALNPHAGEDGLFGDEEVRFIVPAVRELRAAGMDAEGPFPADTLLARAAQGAFDGVVAMYHDQGHIAIKLLAMFDAVNITLGLPIVRTSVAHGTALDIAWKGIANYTGLISAVEACSILASQGKIQA